MIPDHLVYRAAQAIWETGTTSEWRNDVWAAPHLTRARAALEAVAADIWEDGYDAGSDDERAHHLGVSLIDINQHTPNPYKRNETA